VLVCVYADRTHDRDQWASTVQLFIYVQPTDHPSNAEGGSATVSTTVKWGSALAVTLVTNVNMLGNTTDVITVTATPGESALY